MDIMRKLTRVGALCLIFAGATSPVAPPPPAKPDPVQQYRSLVDQLPDSVPSYVRTHPSLKDEIPTSYKYLRETCPAMRMVDIKIPWNLSNWMNEKITAEEWKAAPYSFRMNSFRAVAVQKNTDIKTNLLGKIYNNLDFHPAFIVWMDDGKERFNKALDNDPYLRDAKKHWEWTTKKDSRLKKYSAHVGKLLVESFLPGVDLKYPDIHLTTELPGRRGLYAPASNLVFLNIGNADYALKTPYDFDRTTSHEFFHFVELNIRNWFLSGKLQDNIPMKDAGQKFFYSYNGDLAHVADTKNNAIYQNTFHERASYYIVDAVKASKDMLLTSRRPEWIDKNPLADNNQHPENGVMPAACNIK